MAKYLTNKETQAALERIIIQAKKRLILISPYIKLTNTMFARIKMAADNGVIIKIIFRTNKVDRAELDKLKTIKNIELKSTNDLHAKCYFNEDEMIITSLNLLEASEKNWEMGISIDRNLDKEIYEAARIDALTIFNDSQSIQIPNANPIISLNNNLLNSVSVFSNVKIAAKVKFIICDKLGVDEKEIVPNANFTNDLGADSLDIVELIMEFEKEFNISIPDAEAEKIFTIKQAIEYLDYRISRTTNNSKNEEGNIEYYDEFIPKWNEYLIKYFPKINFTKTDKLISAENFPIINIDFSTSYGFITLNFNDNIEKLKKLKEKEQFYLKKKFRNYRLYWNKADQICIYHAKDISFINREDNIKYCAEGLERISEELKRFYF